MAETKGSSVCLRNTITGAVVEVREDKVALLGSEWEPAEQSKQAAPKRRTSKSE